MVTENRDRKVNTTTKVTDEDLQDVDTPRLPHERDESPNGQEPLVREDMRQAAADLERGLVDTDLHGVRGVERVVKPTPVKDKA